MEPRHFESGASASPPSAPGSPSNGYPSNGNPGTGTPATVPGAYWFHQVAAELRNVIASAGLTPDDSDLTQLNQAIPIAAYSATAWAHSFTSEGYQKFPSGLIIQWGNNATSTPCYVTYPIEFPNDALVVIGCDGDFSPTAAGTLLDTKARFGAYGELNYWIAIGH